MTKLPSFAVIALVALVGAVLFTACGGSQSTTVERSTSDAMPAAFTDPDAAFADREVSGENLIYA